MRKDDDLANKWLKQNGIAVKGLEKMDLCLQQAQMVATNLLNHHAKWLKIDEYTLLTTYTKTVRLKSNQNKAYRATAYKVLNVGKRINRQLFRQHKISNANKSLR